MSWFDKVSSWFGGGQDDKDKKKNQGGGLYKDVPQGVNIYQGYRPNFDKGSGLYKDAPAGSINRNPQSQKAPQQKQVPKKTVKAQPVGTPKPVQQVKNPQHTHSSQPKKQVNTPSNSSNSSLYRNGSRGNSVAHIQKMLGISSDGIYGSQTEAAVRKFQQANGLKVDGVVGPNTMAALKGKSPLNIPSTNTPKNNSNSTPSNNGVKKGANGKPVLPTKEELQLDLDYKDYATELPSLGEVQEKWGLEDASEYAQKIAEKNEQIKLDNIAAMRDLLNQNTREAQETLEIDYFGQYRNMQEDNALRGLNAGIARQNEMQVQMDYNNNLGGILRDKNRELAGLERDEARVELERQAEELQLKQQETQRQIDLAFKQGNWDQAENLKRMEVDLKKEMNRIENEMYLYEQENKEWWNNKEFDFNQEWKQKEFGFAQEKFAFQKQMERQQMALQQQRLAEQRAARAAQDAYRRQQAAAQEKQQQQKRKADGSKLLNDALYEMRTGDTEAGQIMKGIANAWQDGLYTDAEYKNAIIKLNEAHYQSRYKK